MKIDTCRSWGWGCMGTAEKLGKDLFSNVQIQNKEEIETRYMRCYNATPREGCMSHLISTEEGPELVEICPGAHDEYIRVKLTECNMDGFVGPDGGNDAAK